MSLAQRLAQSSRRQTSPADRLADLGPVARRLHGAISEMSARSAEHPLGAMFGQLIPVFVMELRKLPDDTLRSGLLSMSEQLRAIALGEAVTPSAQNLPSSSGESQTQAGEAVAAGPAGGDPPGPLAT